MPSLERKGLISKPEILYMLRHKSPSAVALQPDALLTDQKRDISSLCTCRAVNPSGLKKARGRDEQHTLAWDVEQGGYDVEDSDQPVRVSRSELRDSSASSNHVSPLGC